MIQLYHVGNEGVVDVINHLFHLTSYTLKFCHEKIAWMR